MLFPDYSHVLIHSIKWTATEDCFVVISYYGSENYKAGSLYIDGVAVAEAVHLSNGGGYVFFSGYVAKGSLIQTTSLSGFTAYALKHGGS